MSNEVWFETNDDLLHLGGDRWVRDVDVTISEEDLERIRQGYMCLKCFQRFEHAFPEVCTFPLCDFRVRERQIEELGRIYAGVLEQAEEMYDQDALDEQAREHYRSKGIWLPGS